MLTGKRRRVARALPTPLARDVGRPSDPIDRIMEDRRDGDKSLISGSCCDGAIVAERTVVTYRPALGNARCGHTDSYDLQGDTGHHSVLYSRVHKKHRVGRAFAFRRLGTSVAHSMLASSRF